MAALKFIYLTLCMVSLFAGIGPSFAQSRGHGKTEKVLKELSSFLPLSKEELQKKAWTVSEQMRGSALVPFMIFQDKKNASYWHFQKEHLQNGEYLKRKFFYEWFVAHYETAKDGLCSLGSVLSPDKNILQVTEELCYEQMNWSLHKPTDWAPCSSQAEMCGHKNSWTIIDEHLVRDMLFDLTLGVLRHLGWDTANHTRVYLHQLLGHMSAYFQEAQEFQQKRLSMKKHVLKAKKKI